MPSILSSYNLVENVDYQLVPAEDSNNDQAWDVKFLSGDFSEVIVRYGHVRFDGTEEQPVLSFDYKLIFTPISDLQTTNPSLQEFAGDVLMCIILRSVADGTAIFNEVKPDSAD